MCEWNAEADKNGKCFFVAIGHNFHFGRTAAFKRRRICILHTYVRNRRYDAFIGI